MRKEQLQRYYRYFKIYLRHFTLKKIINLLKVELKLAFNDSDVEGLFPYYLVIDISSTCNLRCPLCQTGLKKNIKRKNLISLENYIKIVEPVKNYVFQIFLYNWGEPFLNKDIYDIIAYNSRNNIATSVSSNFNIPIDADRLVESKLTHLIISADGITQDVYSKYRVQGDINNVYSNLNKLVEAKQKHKSKYPHIEWQCLVTKFNEKQLNQIREKAFSMGADEVRFSNLNFYSVENDPSIQEKWLPENKRYRQFESDSFNKVRKSNQRKPCFWLWRSAIITADGGIIPCCLYDIQSWDNILDTGLIPSWNNIIYLEARNRSKNNPKLKNQEIICDRCTASYIYK